MRCGPGMRTLMLSTCMAQDVVHAAQARVRQSSVCSGVKAQRRDSARSRVNRHEYW